MPQKQTIMWTALPSGVKSGGVLQLSVFVSPRLETDQGLPRPQLSQFPDFQNWTAKVQGVQFSVQFEGGSPVQATRVGPALEPALWTALFKPTTYVQPYQTQDYSSRLIHSHPVANVNAFVKAQYQTIGAASPTSLPTSSTLGAQLAPISLYQAPAALPVHNVAVYPMGAQHGTSVAQQTNFRDAVIPSGLHDFVRALPAPVQPSATRNLNALVQKSLPLQPAAAQAFQSIYQELQQNKAVRAGSSPQPTVDFLRLRMHFPPQEGVIAALQPPDIDFHKLISTLGNYPELMRRLGLVIDLEVPLAPDVSGSTVKVLPTWAANDPPSAFNTDFSARTACLLDTAKGRFSARPQASGSHIVNGMLNLSNDADYPVVNVDVTGSALKMVNLADRLVAASTLQTPVASAAQRTTMLQRTALHSSAAASAATAASAPDQSPAALPALRTSGISLAQTDRAAWFSSVMARVALNNQAVSANTPDQVTHYADDLVRGYRVDVWDAQSQSWLSLCRRQGTYNFFEAGLTRQIDDEGFVQLGVTQSADPTSGGEPPKDLYLQESMFTWNGWSLAAPRPGKTIAPNGTPQALDDPAVAQTRASSDFKMVASFAPQPGTLPRLRFGNTYRIRARVVDLAGNGLGPGDPAPGDFSAATPPHLYTRFEPVVAPLAVMTKTLDGAKSPGESLGRPVLRSNFDKSATEYAPIYGNYVSDSTYTPFTLRLIAPPKTSQAMAERHGMFDSPSGAMQKDASTYQMIAAKAEGAFMIDPMTRLPIQSNLAIPYLPDPLSRGAALSLTNIISNTAATSPGVSFYPTGAGRPNAVPFLLKVAEGTGATSAQWDESSRTLTIQIAKAQVVALDLSSLLGDGAVGTRNQQLMGVWNWIAESAPANLAKLRQYVGAGRHWMVTPSRELVLVHAVQQPLIAPQFHALAPSRHLAETFAYIADDQTMAIDGPSTLKVDIEAAWQEPLDDVNDPSGPKTLNGSAHVHEWKLTTQDTAIEITASVALVQGSGSSSTPTGIAAAPGSGRHKVVAAPLAQQRMNALEARDLTVSANASKFAVKPGQMIPVDVRVARPGVPAPQKFGYSFRHDFGDTKYRKVNYTAVATTRFAEYFPITDAAQLSRSSAAYAVDVPNSVRPPLPKVLYVVPTFGWERRTNVNFEKGGANVGGIPLPNLKGTASISERRGGGLRVYLDRPWYATGDGELLGVVVWPSPPPPQMVPGGIRQLAPFDAQPTTVRIVPGAISPSASVNPNAMAKMVMQQMSVGAAVPDTLGTLVTQWGVDPIWRSSPLPADLPTLGNFQNPQSTGTGLTLEELADQPASMQDAYRVAVAGYKPEFDKDRGLWYCDIVMDAGASYFPFVRLALVRFQPISVENAHLSHVVRADFAQLTPDRSVTVVYDPRNRKRVDVAVSGLSYAASQAASGPAEMEISVEAKLAGADADLGWVPVPSATFGLSAQASGPVTVWRGEIRLDRYKVPKQQELRLVIREYETFLADKRGPQLGEMAVASPAEPVRRLVYADVVSIPPLV